MRGVIRLLSKDKKPWTLHLPRVAFKKIYKWLDGYFDREGYSYRVAWIKTTMRKAGKRMS